MPIHLTGAAGASTALSGPDSIGCGVPIPSRERAEAMPYVRRDGSRRAQGQSEWPQAWGLFPQDAGGCVLCEGDRAAGQAINPKITPQRRYQQLACGAYGRTAIELRGATRMLRRTGQPLPRLRSRCLWTSGQ